MTSESQINNITQASGSAVMIQFILAIQWDKATQKSKQ